MLPVKLRARLYIRPASGPRRRRRRTSVWRGCDDLQGAGCERLVVLRRERRGSAPAARHRSWASRRLAYVAWTTPNRDVTKPRRRTLVSACLFIGRLCLGSGAGGFACERGAAAIALDVHLENGRMVDETVDGGDRHLRVCKQPVPFAERRAGGDQQRATFISSGSSGQHKGRMNPGVLESVRVTASHHALAGQVVRIVRRKRHRGEAYVVVEVQDGSRQLIAVRNTELADGRSSSPDLRFTPGSLRALVDVIVDCRERAQREGVDAAALPDQSSGMGIAATRHVPAGRDALDRAAAASVTSESRRFRSHGPRRS